MIDFKKMDDQDFVFINKTLSEKEEKEFSDFLKKRKSEKLQTSNKKKSTYSNVSTNASVKASAEKT